jgi:nicotinic acid mononucleotide adenylyltransferase
MTEKILLTKIRLDGGTQPRKELDENLVQHYTEEILEGQEFPPVDLHFDGKHYWLSDGFHRWHAHKRAGHKDITSNVIQGTKRDAFIASLKANAQHGKARTADERRYVVQLALEDIELGELSDTQIAQICLVSNMTVGRVRKALGLKKETTVGKDGKRRDTSNIGRKTVAPIPEFEEEDKLNELATEISAVSEENTKLKDMLAVRSLPVSEEARAEVQETIESLREQVKELEAKVRSLTQSRDEFMAKNAEMLKQINYWKRRAEKAA